MSFQGLVGVGVGDGLSEHDDDVDEYDNVNVGDIAPPVAPSMPAPPPPLLLLLLPCCFRRLRS